MLRMDWKQLRKLYVTVKHSLLLRLRAGKRMAAKEPENNYVSFESEASRH